MSTRKSVVITLPKRVGSKVSGFGDPSELRLENPKFTFATSILTARARAVNGNEKMERKPIIRELEDSMPMDSSELTKADMWLRGKKRRLDHLTWEEKLQRKKLKNRVAAQTSRDRKKAKLDELEDTVKALRDSHDLLSQECEMLRSRNESLMSESKRLTRERDEARATPTTGIQEQRYCSTCQGRVGCAAPTLGSAVSPINPLPQGGAAQPAPSPTTLSTNASIILKIMTLYLLSRNSSASSTATATTTATIISNDSRNSPRAFCAKLPQKWKQVLVNQINRSRSSKIPLKNLTIQKEWWGRHQKMWKPVQRLKV